MTANMRTGVIVVGVALVLAGFLTTYERFFGRKRLRFPYLARSIPAETYSALASKPGWAKSAIEVEPGIELRGLVRKPSNAGAPWVLFYPGNDESQLERGQTFLTRLGADQDWGLAVFPYRGYDASDGKPELDAIAEDAPRIALELCAQQGITPSQLHIAGFSIGGHFAVHAAGGAAQQGRRAASLTLWAPANDIIMFFPSPWEKLTSGEDYQTVPYLGKVPGPVLVLQGSADSAFEGPEQGKAIAKALGEKAKYHEIPGEDHVPLLANRQALEAMRQFVREHSK